MDREDREKTIVPLLTPRIEIKKVYIRKGDENGNHC